MDNQAIEQTAIHAVQTRVNLTKYLSSFLDSNDKTPSWDGFIYIYESDRKIKENLTGRLPAQIKGHLTNDFSNDTISYNIEIAHLRNYLNDGGAMLFVVYLAPNEDQTDFLKKIYYTELTPVKISSFISEIPIIQNSKAIHLKAVPNHPDDFASLVHNCYSHCKRQASFANVKLQTVEELQAQGNLESLEFFISGYGEDYKGPNGFLKLDTPLYARTKGSLIPQPIKFEGEMLEKSINYTVNNTVTCDGKVFFKQYTITQTIERSILHLGYGITLTFEHSKKGWKFNYKASHMLRQFVSDAPFMFSFVKMKEFKINDESIDFSNGNINSFGYNLEKHKEEYERLSRYVQMLDQQGCFEDIDYSKLTKEDWRNLERLTQATLDNKPVYGLKNDLEPIVAICVGPLKFAVGLTHLAGEEGAYTLCHAQDCKDFIFGFPDHNEIIPVPISAIFRPDDYATLSNIRFDQILPSMQQFPVNKHTYSAANQIMLNMIAASDMTDGKRRKILLETALKIAEWLESMPDAVWEKNIAILNKLQIIVRQRPLTEDERAELLVMTIICKGRDEIMFAAYVLLGKKDEAVKSFNNLPLQVQDEMKKYPIYHYYISL